MHRGDDPAIGRSTAKAALRPAAPTGRAPGRRPSGVASGFTVVELLIVVAILATLAAILIANLLPAIQKAKRTRVMSDLRTLEKQILAYELSTGALPDSLDEIGYGGFLDSWGHPYRYLRIRGGKDPRGKWRKDRFLVPLNSDFDLYSVGPDGDSKPPLTAKASRDDIVRANNGGFIGLASDY